MELKKRLDFKKVLIGLYAIFFAVYLIIGLQPVEATDYEVSAELSIPSISLNSDVTTLYLENGKLNTPDYIVGSFSKAKNKTILIGHSSTVFKDLNKVKMEDEIIYDETEYIVKEIKVLEKSEIDMNNLLKKAEEETLVVMTCAGENLGGGDATHRLIITAVAK